MVPTGNPFSSLAFESTIQQLMQQNNLPQISFSAVQNNISYIYSYTNPSFTGFGATPPVTNANSMFRIASIAKPFTAAAIMSLVQNGYLSLSSKPFQILGFFNAQGNPVQLNGYDPVTGAPVTVSPSPALLSVTVQSLLNMGSGLPLNMPVQSATFPTAQANHVEFTQGSYAALAFAGAFQNAPYTGPPASVYQQIAYYVYAFSHYNLSLVSPGTYNYSNTGYGILGAVADTVAEQVYGLNYAAYLQNYILTPMGISAPSSNPSPSGTPMVGIAHTLQSQAYPTEVSYYADPTEGLANSIFPNPTATKSPFDPSTQVPEPYGGGIYYESNFAEEGLAANPLALTTLTSNLWAAYKGATTGPLSPATVQEMVSLADGTPIDSTEWFGLGFRVTAAPGTTSTPGKWTKGGSDPGTNSQVTQNSDGTTWSFVMNEDNNDATGLNGQTFMVTLTNAVNAALYPPPPPSNPFNSATFQSTIQQLMQQDNLPQISFAAVQNGNAFTYTYTNPSFTGFGKTPPTTNANSIFRVASVAKVFTAAAIMNLVQDGYLSLSSNPFQILGYFNAQGTPVPVSGYDPVTGKPVTVTPSTALSNVTVENLLNMSSGLPLNIPVQSASFPNAQPNHVEFTQGSYAALAFAGDFNNPPYTGPPASVYQQIAYYVYAFAHYNLSLVNPGTYTYSNTGYGILGAVADTVAERVYGLNYASYLQQYILTPMGISAPSASPPPSGIPMLGIAHTLQTAAYPTEVNYYPDPNEPPGTSIFPNPTATKAPFYPKAQVPRPYGAGIYYESNFGEEGLAANPLAMTAVTSNLWAAYNGATAGPLSPATVKEMFNPAFGTPINSTQWFGLGWQVTAAPGTTNTPGTWTKGGSDPGTASQVNEYSDGTSWAYVMNEDNNVANGLNGQGFMTTLTNAVNAALYPSGTPAAAGLVHGAGSGNGSLGAAGSGLPSPLPEAAQVIGAVPSQRIPTPATAGQVQGGANGNGSLGTAGSGLPSPLAGADEVLGVLPSDWIPTTANPTPNGGRARPLRSG
jgi:CubicO group peptidase (beta-lactamase class C family)